MKNFLFIVFALLCLSSCGKEDTSNIVDPENDFANALVGDWFRSHPVKVWGGHNQPSFERGERRYTMTFLKDGSFILDQRTFGLYEGTTLDDLNGFRKEHGSYTVEGNVIDIRLTHYEWFDTWHEDMTGPETITLQTNWKWRFLDATGEIDGELFTLRYHETTDMIDPNSPTPGIINFVDEYLRLP